MSTTPSTGRGTLSRDRIVRAALDLAESDGIEQLSLHKVGAALGVRAMSLYRYIADKSDLYDAMGDVVLGEIEVNSPDDVPWEEALAAISREFRTVLLRYPHSAPLILTRRLNAP